jgi:hypothetical protein
MHQVPYISDDCLDLTLTHLTIVWGINGVDRPFSNGGQLMCHEDASPDANLLKTVLVLLGHLMLQHKIL